MSDEIDNTPWYVKLWEYFSRRDVPLWATFVIAGASALAANFLLPHINKQNEYEKMRSAFTLQSLNDLNNQTSALVGMLRASSESDVVLSLDQRIQFEKIITSLQWEAIEISMFIRDGENPKIVAYQSALNGIRDCMNEKTGKFDDGCYRLAVANFLAAAEGLGHELTGFQ